MEWLLVALVALPVIALVAAAATGRARLRSCCSVPPEQDRRLRT
jgi:hypothetical protein